MNERIKELAQIANIEFTYDTTETPMQVFVECWENELEKFAELIIKECLSVCEEREKANLYGIKEVKSSIKQHFGVN